MPRLESIVKAGFYEFPQQHLDAVATLVAPGRGRLLDPCAGDGTALAHLSTAWKLEAFANELDKARALECIQKFGAAHAVEGDLYRLRASQEGFNALWVNPPYSENFSDDDERRRELDMLKHSWKWAQRGGLVFWVVYQHHVTVKAAQWLSRRCKTVDVWGIPGKHLGEYSQVVVVGQVGKPDDDHAVFQHIIKQAETPKPLEAQASPIYELPEPRTLKQLIFLPDQMTAALAESLARERGVQTLTAFQELVAPPPPMEKIRPVMQPRSGQMAMVLASGLFNGLVLNTDVHGRVAVKGTLVVDERMVRTEVEGEGENKIEREIYKIKPVSTVTLLTEKGDVIDISGEGAMIDFIQTHKQPLMRYFNREYPALYNFDMGDLKPLLDAVRIKGNTLYATQKHVIAALHRALQTRRGVVLCGQMGSGKSIMGSTLLVTLLKTMPVKPGQVNLVMCPPHLLDKWAEELRYADAGVYTAKLKRIQDVRAFMAKAESLPANQLKVGLIPREMAKLGEGWEPAVVWRKHHLKVDGELTTVVAPHCPRCGEEATRKSGGSEVTMSAGYLKRSKRKCPACDFALWQDARTFSKPKPGQKFPTKNPRMALAEYIARIYPDRIYAFVADEVHELEEIGTGQGAAFATLSQIAQKVIGLTGTLFKGKAGSLYGLEFTINPRVCRYYPWGGSGLTRWVREMGVLQKVIEHRPEFDETGAFTGVRTSETKPHEAPGASPLLVREILDHCVFVSLRDFGKALPDLEEIPVPVSMDRDMEGEYKHAKEEMGKYLFKCRMDGDFSFSGAYLQSLLSWPSAAFRPENVVHKIRLDRDDKTKVFEHPVHRFPGFGAERVYPKEDALLEIVERELAAGRNVAIFLRQTGERDIQPRLEKLIRERIPAARPFILRASVAAEKRDALIRKQVASGTNVLICNPVLVQTGLDLLDFTRIVFYEVLYSLTTMGQSAARHWRLNQKHDCKTYYLYYTGTMEERAVGLIAKKKQAADLLYGELGEGSLSDFDSGEDLDLLTELASTINKDEQVTDLRALFAAHASTTSSTSDSAWEFAPEPTEEAVTKMPLPPIRMIEVAPTITPDSEPEKRADEFVQLALF